MLEIVQNILFEMYDTETEMSSGWLLCSSLGTLKASVNVPGDQVKAQPPLGAPGWPQSGMLAGFIKTMQAENM